MLATNRWDDVSGQASISEALGKKGSKIVLPAVDGRTPYPAKALELFQGMLRIASLSKGRDDE
jgi:hypothetical protein